LETGLKDENVEFFAKCYVLCHPSFTKVASMSLRLHFTVVNKCGSVVFLA